VHVVQLLLIPKVKLRLGIKEKVTKAFIEKTTSSIEYVGCSICLKQRRPCLSMGWGYAGGSGTVMIAVVIATIVIPITMIIDMALVRFETIPIPSLSATTTTTTAVIMKLMT
jgi:hypothetical protein